MTQPKTEQPLQLTCYAPAKVNLTLQVGGTRPDGYHELDSLLMPVTLFDTLTFEPSNDLSLCHSSESEVPTTALGDPQQNLIIRAAKCLQEYTSTSAGATITLLKRIPTGAGLGGGSSDCASTFLALNELWGLNLPLSELEHLAATLGSDIPAFIRGGVQRMLGRGERLETPWSPVETSSIPPYWLVLVNCGEHCSTKEVYSRYTPRLTSAPSIYYTAHSMLPRGNADALAPALLNDLQACVYQHYPKVAQSAQALVEAGAVQTLLSGSGATVFGLARSYEHAMEIAHRIPDDYWKRIVHTIARWCNGSTRDFDSLCPSSNLGRATTASKRVEE